MTVAGMIRFKNGARWIYESVRSLLAICSQVFVLDNHSTDGTAEIVGAIEGAALISSPFENLNEARDKSFLLSQVRGRVQATWIVMIDADEVLLDPDALRANLDSRKARAYKLNVLFLWDRPDQIRVDGIYGDFWHASVFRNESTNGLWVQRNPNGPNLHCDSVPTDLSNNAVRCSPAVRLKHYGPMLREDRIAKYHFYRSVDPNNPAEDDYRHSVMGDLPEFPRDARYRHDGPLKLAPFSL
jgi:glycosyltransferase involved in cell wall biosynthesis